MQGHDAFRRVSVFIAETPRIPCRGNGTRRPTPNQSLTQDPSSRRRYCLGDRENASAKSEIQRECASPLVVRRAARSLSLSLAVSSSLSLSLAVSSSLSLSFSVCPPAINTRVIHGCRQEGGARRLGALALSLSRALSPSLCPPAMNLLVHSGGARPIKRQKRPQRVKVLSLSRYLSLPPPL